jgi:hypothetical protein
MPMIAFRWAAGERALLTRGESVRSSAELRWLLLVTRLLIGRTQMADVTFSNESFKNPILTGP